jgi:hypothetical protein
VLVAAGTLLVAWRTGFPGPLERLDVRQHRLDSVAPVPDGGVVLEQGFVARHDGLAVVELLLAVRPGAATEVPSRLTLRLLDPDGNELQARSWEGGALSHNAPLRFTFPPQSNSAGQVYRLRLEGSSGNQASVWAFSVDAYPGAELLVNGEPAVGDLRFQTSYRYTLPAALRDLGRVLGNNVGLTLMLAILSLLPGMALLSLTLGQNTGRFLSGDPAVLLGTALAGSLPCLATGWLWWSVLGGRWSGPFLWGALGVTTALLVAQWFRRRRRLYGGFRFSRETALLAVVLGLGLAARLVAVRDLVLPAWVDSPQHYLISRMMAESGRVPNGYRPWMPVDSFWYHFGYHALTASLHQMSGLPIERLMLVGGQVLNGLAPLSVYAGTTLLTKRRRAGLLGAFLVALPSLFPAYYVAWGRYTQLCGLLVLAPLMGLLYRLAVRAVPGEGVSPSRPTLWCGLVLGGLFLVHARVWVYAMVWLVVVALSIGRSTRLFLSVTGLAAACAAPWWLRVGRLVLLPLAGRMGGGPGASSYNDIPWGYLTFGWERVWLALGALGLLWAVWRRERSVVTLGGWVAAVFAFLNLERVGVPTFWLVNNNTWLISLFVPVAAAAGWAVDDWWRRLAIHRLGRIVGVGGMTAGLVWSGLLGLHQGAGAATEQTTLAGADDLALIRRAKELLPPDGLVAVNAWPWMGPNAWAGSDGGYWLMPLAGVPTTMPPIGYNMEVENRDLVNGFNQRLAEVEDWEAAETLALLRDRGVTHVFIGERGGTLRPEDFLGSSGFELVDREGGAWLFEVRYAN